MNSHSVAVLWNIYPKTTPHRTRCYPHSTYRTRALGFPNLTTVAKSKPHQNTQLWYRRNQRVTLSHLQNPWQHRGTQGLTFEPSADLQESPRHTHSLLWPLEVSSNVTGNSIIPLKFRGCCCLQQIQPLPPLWLRQQTGVWQLAPKCRNSHSCPSWGHLPRWSPNPLQLARPEKVCAEEGWGVSPTTM